MCPRRSYILAPLIEVDRGPKDRKIIWNDGLEDSFKEIKHIASTKTLSNHPDCTIPFTIYTYDSDKQFGAVISQNNIPTAFFL